MAEVYLALSGDLPGFRTLVVVKRILPHLASNSQFIRMFLDEARLASLLDHPNVVRIIEVGHDGEDYFLAMELVQGKPLSAVLRKAAREKAPLTPALAAHLIGRAASGLGYAHTLTDGDGRALGIVHRDVSPQNILVSFEGAIKLIDFGVARAYGRVAYTSPGGLKGKIDYMSPEQASAEEVDHRADVFALGVVLWEVLTGKRLFRRETELATMRAIVDEPIARPSEVTEVPAELEAIVMKALRKRRDARYANAQEMAAALEQYAFSHAGFTPLDLPAYVKRLFASEYLQWRKTASAALDLAVEPVGRSAGRASSVDLNAEPATSGPTMALRPSGSWPDGREPETRATTGSRRARGSRSGPRIPEPHPIEHHALSVATDATASVATGAPTRGDRAWVYGGIAILAAVAVAGAWVLARPPAGPLESVPQASPTAPPASAYAPPASAAEPSATAPQTLEVSTEVPTAPPETPAEPSQAEGVRRTTADSASWKALSRPIKAAPRPRVQKPRARKDVTGATGPVDAPAAPTPLRLNPSKADPFED
jgi:serine/threonine-protein kinase